MRLVLFSLGLLCLLGLSVGQEVKSFFDFFFDFEYKRSGGRIVGGASVTIARYPFAVSLRRYSNHICSATVISTYYAATSAHCTYSMTNLASVTIYAGSTSRTTGGKVFVVTKNIVHPNFDLDTFDADVAVVRVQTPFTPNTNISPVPLAALDYVVPTGVLPTVVGWGRTSSAGALSPSLRAVSLPVVKSDSCAAMWNDANITNNMLCAGTSGKDACVGDSGGSMVVPNNNYFIFIGLVSWGSASCGSEYPGVYARTTSADMRNFLMQYV